MPRRIVQTRAAERDIAEQVAYIATDRPAAARRYLVAIAAAYDRLLRLPEVGVLRSFPVRGCEAVRLWPVPGFRRFLVAYRATPKAIEVIRVLHSARDLRRALRRS